MHIAYLILAHSQPRHLGRLVEQLDDGNANFVIHVDAKYDIDVFRQAITSERATLVSERLPINWGGWRMVQATLNMLRQARSQGRSDYYQLLSDSCYPIKSNKHIAGKLHANSLNYITINHELAFQSPHFGRIGRYHWPDLVPARALRRFHRLSRRIQRGLPTRRLPWDLQPYKGWQWWCLSQECIDYVLSYIEARPEVTRYFRYTSIPDESFFHTIIGNSKFADKLLPGLLSPGFEEGTIAGNHYVRWHRGKPCVLKEDAFEKLIKSDACFARKFDETASLQLTERLREFWRTNER